MMQPLYKQHEAPEKPLTHSHKGLWYDRFFNGYSDTWTVDSKSKQQWIDTVKGACGDLKRLSEVSLRTSQMVKAMSGSVFSARSDWHFATGLGLPHPVENGFQWHPTLGVPYLPGSAVKGLLRAWYESWADPFPEGSTLHGWFGSENKDPRKCRKDAQTGSFIFLDALPVECPILSADVMTPHMGQWYADGAQRPLDANTSPGDWHNPVPVPFLVSAKTTLLFAVIPRDSTAQKELPALMMALQQALDWLGAGAKTAVGYGHFVRDEEIDRKIQKCIDQLTEQQIQEQKDRELEDSLRSLPQDLAVLMQHKHEHQNWANKELFYKDVGAILTDYSSLTLEAWQWLHNEMNRQFPDIMMDPDAKEGKKKKPKYKEMAINLAKIIIAIDPSP